MAAGIHLLMGLPTVLESRCPCWPSSNFYDVICLLKDRHVQHGTSSSVTPLSSVYTCSDGILDRRLTHFPVLMEGVAGRFMIGLAIVILLRPETDDNQSSLGESGRQRRKAETERRSDAGSLGKTLDQCQAVDLETICTVVLETHES